VPVIELDELDTFLTLVETLKAGGWTIQKFEDLGGAVALTILPLPKKKERE
jgi:hypothetical protein